jgi:hypothetical protein
MDKWTEDETWICVVMTYFSPPGLCPMSLVLHEKDTDEDTNGQIDKRMKVQIDK